MSFFFYIAKTPWDSLSAFNHSLPNMSKYVNRNAFNMFKPLNKCFM